jgi:hypothetical protein
MEATKLEQRVPLFFLMGLVLLSPFIYDWLAWVKPLL